jgi:hypothetical protein
MSVYLRRMLYMAKLYLRPFYSYFLMDGLKKELRKYKSLSVCVELKGFRKYKNSVCLSVCVERFA